MAQTMFTIIDDGIPVRVTARVAAGGVRLGTADVEAVFGWAVTPEGLCRDGACLVVPPGSRLVAEDGIDLEELAALMDRPFALDVEERAAYLGIAARDRAAALASLQAPDFSLPDLDGRLHSLSEHRGKKVLLVAYASW